MPDRRTLEIESPPNETEPIGGDQDIDTAGTEADDQSVAARTDPNRERQDRNVEEPGDTNSADIVGRTGEQMPRQSHDGIESAQRESPSRHADDNVDSVDEAPRTSRAS